MDTPRLLLEYYLKQLRLPTMVREFPKLSEQCAQEGATFEQFLLRLVEQEMLDRERRATERRIHAAHFPVSKSLDTYDFLAISFRQLREYLQSRLPDYIIPLAFVGPPAFPVATTGKNAYHCSLAAAFDRKVATKIN